MNILTKRVPRPEDHRWEVILPNGERTYREDRDRAYHAAINHAAYGGGGTVVEGDGTFTVVLKSTRHQLACPSSA